MQNNPILIKRQTFFDDRGFFREVFRASELDEKIGFKFRPVQMNHSLSKPRVVRALHAENWNKLVYPVTGKMFAALVDIRENSKTFGKVTTYKFNCEGGNSSLQALFIPKGFANSICVIGNKPVNYIYLVDAYYNGSDTRAIAWNDPDLNIKWPVENPILSERDKNNPTMRQLFPNKYE